MPLARGGFLDEYPGYRAALWCSLDRVYPRVPLSVLASAMDIWGPRFDPSRRGGYTVQKGVTVPTILMGSLREPRVYPLIPQC